MVDYNGLENRRTERYRGFESLSLRHPSLNLTNTEDTVMKPKKKMHEQEAYELDNYLNEDDDRYYEASSNATIWYS